jgi:hypothetical protein
MAGCRHCDFRGWVDSYFIASGKSTSMIMPCQKCRDVAAYSGEIQRRAKMYEDAGAVIARYEQRQGTQAIPPVEAPEGQVIFADFKEKRRAKSPQT